MNRENNENRPAWRTARRWQPLVCIALLAIIVGTSLVVDLLVNNEAFGIWMDNEWMRINDTPNFYARQYLDTEDRVVLQELPSLDCSSGGVYFFGSSNMKWATRVPDLPPDERRVIHNFGAGEGAPWFQRQFVEYLVEHKNLLQAGPEKTLVVYGTSFLNTTPALDNDRTVFSNMWRRYGLYDYDFHKGVDPISVGPIADKYFLERARCTSFVQACIDRAGRSLVPKSMRRRNTTKDPVAYAASYKARMGPDWEKNFESHRDDLEHLLGYLRSKRIGFAIVLLPLASWHAPLPYPAKYRELVTEFCKTNKVPLIDFSNLLTDDEFNDHIHVNELGLDVLAPALMKIALDHLHRTGALPAESASHSGS